MGITRTLGASFVLVATLAACSSFGSTSGPAAGPDSGSGDADRDAAAAVITLPEGGALPDASVASCAGFGDAFERDSGNVKGEWDRVPPGGGELALAIERPDAGSGGALGAHYGSGQIEGALLQKEVARCGSPKMTVRFRYLCPNDFSRKVDIFAVEPLERRAEEEIFVYQISATGRLGYHNPGNGVGGKVQGQTSQPPPTGDWVAVTISLDFTQTKVRVTIRDDKGFVPHSYETSTTPAKVDAIRIGLGADFGFAGEPQQIYFDDVTVALE